MNSSTSATFFLVILTLAVVAWPGATLFAASPRIDEIDKRILQGRRSIHSYDLEVEADASLESGRRINMKFEFWASGDKRRQKEIKSDGTNEVCINDEFGFHYTAVTGQFENTDRTKWPPIHVDPISKIDRSSATYRMHDPMAIMFNPSFFIWYTRYGLERCINGPHRIDISESQAVWHGHPSIRISFAFDFEKSKFEYEVVPSLGYSIVSIRGRIDGAESSTETVCECSELTEVAPSIWFPLSIDSTKSSDGKIVETEHLKLSFRSVNTPIEDKAFTVAGLSLPAGVLLVDHSKSWHTNKSPTTHPGVEVWDGKTVRGWTSADTAATALSSVPKDPLPPRNRWAIWTSAILVLLGAALMGGYLFSSIKERRASAKD